MPKEIIQEADEAKNFIKHNELGMAFDVLQDIAQEHNLSDQAFEKNMMSAAKEMDLVYKK